MPGPQNYDEWTSRILLNYMENAARQSRNSKYISSTFVVLCNGYKDTNKCFDLCLDSTDDKDDNDTDNDENNK